MTATTTSVPLAAFRAIVGAENARRARPADAVDGVVPSFVVEPGSIEEAAATLQRCASSGVAVVVMGGGSKRSWGAAPERADVVVATARMDAVVEHAAGDLVVIAQPGVRLAELQAALAASGQMLALDPPGAGSTLGGSWRPERPARAVSGTGRPATC